MQILSKTQSANFLSVIEGLLLLVVSVVCEDEFAFGSDFQPLKYTIRIRGVFENETEDGLHSLQAASSQMNVTLRIRVVAENVTRIGFVSSGMVKNGTKIFLTRVSSGQVYELTTEPINCEEVKVERNLSA